MNKVLGIIIISLLTTTRFTRGGLENKEEEHGCPPECFCDVVVQYASCIGDKTKISIPTLSWLNNQTKVRRLEIHDFTLSTLTLTGNDQFRLFHYVQELYLSQNQINTIHFSSLNDDDYSTSYLANNNHNSNKDQPLFGLLLLDLSFNNLTRFESRQELSLLKVLDLSHNKIHRIQLNGLEKLESLNLKSNDIEELEQDVFQSLKSLQYINLDSNLLLKLSPNLFSNLPALAHLILSSNPLNLDSGFLFNSRTQFIDISNVGLERVPSVMFRTVRDLRLNNNKLKSILESDFESYPNVGLLVLDENQIETIENDAFGRMDFLTSLWLNGNRLSSLPQNLPSSLKSLQLEENRITALNATSFTQLHNLENLNLHINLITSLDPEIFSPLYNLHTLNLRSNQIDSIYMDTFKNLSQLISLDLSLNPIKVIVNGAFSHFPKLQSLHLARFTEKEIEFDSSIFDKLSLLQILDLSNSKYFTNKILESSILSRGFGLKLLRELNIERCDLKTELSVVCSQLAELDCLVNVKVQGNSFNTSTTTSGAVMLRQVVTRNNSDNENEQNDDNLNSTFSVRKLCPTLAVVESEVRQVKEKGDEANLADVETAKEKNQKKVSLTLTTTTESATTISSVTISSKVPTSTTTVTRRNGPTSRSSTTSVIMARNSSVFNTITTTATQKIMQEQQSPTTSTSTSSYFESPTTSKNTKKNQETNEDAADRGWNRDTSAGREKEAGEVGSIDGFPADLSGRTNSGSNRRGTRRTTGNNSSSSSTISLHNDDFAKGSFHGLVPQKMYLSQSSALASASSSDGNAEDENTNQSLIFKTIFISAGTCLLSVFILLAFGLVLFRLNGGRFVRNTRRSSEIPSESYRRLEDKQELELGFSNKMYYDGGQVYHIS